MNTSLSWLPVTPQRIAFFFPFLLKAFFTQYGVTYDGQMKLLLLVICALGIMIQSLSSCGVAWLSQSKSCCGCSSR